MIVTSQSANTLGCVSGSRKIWSLSDGHVDMPGGLDSTTAAEPQAGDAAGGDRADLHQRGCAEEDEDRRRNGDRGALSIGTERARHAPDCLRHDGHRR